MTLGTMNHVLQMQMIKLSLKGEANEEFARVLRSV
jgi:hypothetical protein